MMDDAYEKLLALLDRHGAAYRLIDHPPEGQTDKVSALRGHPLGSAAKCLILIVKLGRKITRFFLAVVPGDARVDTSKIRALLGATYVGFAATDVAEQLSGSIAGTVLPFTFHPDLILIADPSLQDHDEIILQRRPARSVNRPPNSRLFRIGKTPPRTNLFRAAFFGDVGVSMTQRLVRSSDRR
jgi:Ala-tRNA(Pro) deacylase